MPEWEHGSLIFCAHASRASGPGSSRGQGHCDVFLGNTFKSHSAPLHPGPGCTQFPLLLKDLEFNGSL